MQNAILGSLKLVQLEAPSEPAIDAAALQKELESQIQGEVRFDTITRALYSTDASVYMIRPLGVVIPKNREDVIRIVQICGRMRCPLTMRGGGTSQAGQAIGEGLQVDISKYFNRVLEVNAEERWARVEPGVVLDELNAQLAPLGLRFAPDISTASRATIGGMMANNSAGARSVLYGKTIDHVLEQTVVLSDGSIAEFREIPRDEVPTGDTAGGRAATRPCCVWRPSTRMRSTAAIPRLCAAWAATTWTNSSIRPTPVNLAKMMVGSEGTLGVVLEAKLRLVPLPKAKAVMVIEFADLLEALSAAPVIVSHGPSAVEVMDKSILDNTRQNANLDRIRKSFIEGDPGGHSVRRVLRRQERRPAAAPRRAGRRSARAQARLSLSLRYGSRYAGAHLEPARSRAGPFDGDEGRRQVDLLRRRHGGRAREAAANTSAGFCEIVHDHGTTAGVYAHASVGCLHVRPVVNMKTEEGVAKFESLAKAVADLVLEFGGALSGEHGDGLVRGPFMRQMFGDTLYEAFREIKRTFDPHGIFNPGKIVDSPPHDLESSLRRGVQNAEPDHVVRLFRLRRLRRSGRDVQRRRSVPQETLRNHVPVLHGHARRERLHARPRQHASPRDDGTARRIRAGRSRRLRCSRPVPGMPRLQSRMPRRRGRGALQERIPRRLLDPPRHVRSRRALWAESRMRPSGERALLPCRTGSRAPVSGHDRNRPAAQAARLEARRLSRDGWRGIEPARGFRPAQVTLFNDTFTNHYDPEIGIAAVEVLERGGCSVDVVRPGCCGRPLISQGLLRRRARAGREDRGRLVAHRQPRRENSVPGAELPLRP